MKHSRCVCVHYGTVRVLEHPRCPEHGTGGKTWRVVGIPAHKRRRKRVPAA